MGYTTDFEGRFNLDRELDEETFQLLSKLNDTRRMKRDVGPEYGVEGEFYVEGKGFKGQDHEDNVVNSSAPPATQPGLWCQWMPTADKLGIEWDGGEKFYEYVEWIAYLIEKILKPKGYVLNGTVEWQGEESGDVGRICITDNEVTTQEGRIVWENETTTETDEDLADLDPKEVIGLILRVAQRARQRMLVEILTELKPMMVAQDFPTDLLGGTLMGIFRALDSADIESLRSEELVEKIAGQIREVLDCGDAERMRSFFGMDDDDADASLKGN